MTTSAAWCVARCLAESCSPSRGLYGYAPCPYNRTAVASGTGGWDTGYPEWWHWRRHEDMTILSTQPVRCLP